MAARKRGPHLRKNRPLPDFHAAVFIFDHTMTIV
jgi:hypothetical protein